MKGDRTMEHTMGGINMDDFFGGAGNKQYTCCLCHGIHRGFGNNPKPLVMKDSSRCCDACNMKVIQARIYMAAHFKTDEEAEKFKKMPLRKKLNKMSGVMKSA